MDEYPSFDEIKKFVETNPRATINEIKDEFDQHGDAVCSVWKGDKKLVLSFGIDEGFWNHLTHFIEQEYVEVDEDAFACCISDKQRYVGEGEFIPIVLSIK